ncbi:hypothetical protein YC2023_040600 [Brassica napus]
MRPQIVLFGDSITAQSFRSGGWGSALADAYSRKADVVVRGYGGYNTRWALFLLHHIFPLGSLTPPVATTIFFGANDAALKGRTSDRQHVPVEEYKENIRTMVQHLKKCSPTMLIVLVTPPPIDESGRQSYAESIYGEKAMTEPERTNETTGIYAQHCVALAEELGLRDGLHLTPEGNGVVYEEVSRVFREAWLSPDEMPFDFPHHSQIDGENPSKAFQERCL